MPWLQYNKMIKNDTTLHCSILLYFCEHELHILTHFHYMRLLFVYVVQVTCYNAEERKLCMEFIARSEVFMVMKIQVVWQDTNVLDYFTASIFRVK